MASISGLDKGNLSVATLTQRTTDATSQAAAGLPASSPRRPSAAIASAPREPGTTRTTLAIKIAVGVVAPLIGSLAALGGIGSFATLRHLAIPWFGPAAWIVPVGTDIGILALLAWDLLTEYLGFPWPVLRWTAWAFIAATVYLNIAAAHGNPTAAVMHAAMPVLFVTVMEGIRYLIRQWAGLTSGTRIDHIPTSRWLLAPRSSFLLARRMILWQITSYPQALVLEQQRLQSVARLQENYGRFVWHWKAPLSERLALRLSSAGTQLGLVPLYDDVVDGQDTEPDLHDEQSSVTALLSQLPKRCLVEPPRVPKAPEALNNPDQLLIAAATEILRDAERDGGQISQAALAKKLRERGHRVANARLRWLTTAVKQADPLGMGSRP